MSKWEDKLVFARNVITKAFLQFFLTVVVVVFVMTMFLDVEIAPELGFVLFVGGFILFIMQHTSINDLEKEQNRREKTSEKG